MEEDIDIKWLEEYAEQEKKYKWGKEIKKLIKRNKKLEEKLNDLVQVKQDVGSITYTMSSKLAKASMELLINSDLKMKNKKLQEKNKKLEDTNKKLYELCQTKAMQEFINNECDYIPKSKVREKIEELNKRIDYLDKELAEAYIQREKLGTETELDANEQYIYNMEQERSIRHTEKYAYLKLL